MPVGAEQTLSFGFIHAPLSFSSLSVLKVAYSRIGIRVQGLKLPAARSLEQSDAGLTDGEVHRIRDIEAEHPQLIRIEVPINRVEGMALSCNKPLNLADPDVFWNYRIGIKIGTIYAERLTDGMPSVTKLLSEDKLMDLLVARRLDVVIGDRPWAERQIDMPGHGCVRINEPPLVRIPLYHYLHIRHAYLVPDITRVLREMEESGEMERVIREALDFVRKNPVPEQ